MPVYVDCRICRERIICAPSDRDPLGTLCTQHLPAPTCCADRLEAARRGCRCGGGSR